MNNLQEIFSKAFELFQQKKFNESLSQLSDAETYFLKQITPDWKISIENLKGFNYLGLNNPEDAQYCFEGALQMDEKSSQACAGLGEVLYLNREEAKAKVMFEFALHFNSDNQFAKAGLEKTNYLLDLPKNHNSLTEPVPVEPVAVEEPTFREAVISAGEHFSKADYQAAIEDIKSVEGKIESDLTELAQLLTELSNMKGSSYLNLNKLDEAKSSFEKALNLTPDSSAACQGLAEIFFRSNMLNEAKTMFEWAVQNDQNNKSAKDGLDKTLRALGQNTSSPQKPKRTLKLASGKTIDLD